MEMPNTERAGKRLTFFVYAYWHDRNYRGFLGAVIKIWELAENLTEMGHNVFLFIPQYPLPKSHPPFKVVRIPLLNAGFIRPLCFDCLSFLVSIYYGLLKGANAVYMRRFTSILPLLFSRILRIPFIYEVNDDPYLGRDCYSPRKWSVVKAIERMNLRRCDKISVVTQRIKEKLHHDFDIPLGKMVVIPSCSNTSIFKPMNRAKCTKRIGLDPNRRYVGFIGTFIRIQGPHLLIEATPYILKACPDVRILMVGDGVMRGELEDLTLRKNLKDYVIFTGHVPYLEAPAYINAMDVGTAPFLKDFGETVAVKVYDTLACGRPIVSSDFVKTRSDTSQTGAVLFVEPENPKALAEGIIKLLSDEGLRSTMGERGRQSVMKYFDRSQVARRIVQMALETGHKRHKTVF